MSLPTPPDVQQSHEVFAREYVARGARRIHATGAAEAAGFTSKGYAPHYMLQKPEVQAAIKRELALRFGELEITAQRTFQEMGRIAFSDPAELFNAEGQLLPIDQMSPDQRAAISSIEFETHFQGRGEDAIPVHTIKVKLWDKPAMLKTLAQHFKIITSDKDGLDALAGELAAQLRAGRERAQAARRAPVPPVDIVEEARIIAPPTSTSTQEIPDEEQIW